jgi:hypothetical protein
MNAETIQHAWEWLLGLSKVQLILLGAGMSVLVAVSKIFRFLFLLGLVVVLLTVGLPELSKRYEHSPLPGMMKELLRRGAEATQDQPPAEQPAHDKKN